jgi:hypothetical protein
MMPKLFPIHLKYDFLPVKLLQNKPELPISLKELSEISLVVQARSLIRQGA